MTIRNAQYREDYEAKSPESSTHEEELLATSIYEEEEEILHQANANEAEIQQSILSYFSLASFLRFVGAITVIGAMSSFLLADWESGNDVQRFYIMLAQTGLLTIGGFGLSYLLKENKGARVFFSLGLVSITANMAILGALTCSITESCYAGGTYNYAAAIWQTTPSELSLAIIAGLVVMVPVILFGQRILARRSTKLLAILSIATNLLLLIPVRESIPVGIIAMVASIVPLYFIQQRMKLDVSLKTLEGKIAIATIFAPVVIILGRTLTFYSLDAGLGLMLSIIVYSILRTIATVSTNENKGILAYGSLATAACMAYSIGAILHGTIAIELVRMIGATVLLVIAHDIANTHKRHAGMVLKTASIVMAVCYISALTSNSILLSLICGTAGAVLIAYAVKTKESCLGLAGAAIMISAIVHQLYLVITLAVLPMWAWLAIVGISALIISSIVERHGQAIKYKWNNLTATI